jgi:MerR family Zn(II)-responsive transcriptional regulator of zntA
MSHLLTIGKVAALAEVSPDTIRYYERLALLPKPLRTPAGYRVYADSIVHRLEVIRSAQKFGFSLGEIARFLRVRESGGKPCGEVRAAAGRMLQAVDQQIADLKATRKRMTHTLQAWDERLTRTPANAPAHLLETLVRSRQANTGPSPRSALRAGRARL